MSSRGTDPIGNLFNDISKILSYVEVKDKSKALANETDDSKSQAEMWLLYMSNMDTYLTYVMYWENYMFQEIMPNATNNNLARWRQQPMSVPLAFRDTLLERGREVFISQYVEMNNYYRMLTGLPDYESDDFLYLSDELCDSYGISNSTPIHELSETVQNKFIGTEEYEELKTANPDASYLNYIGIYKIDPYIARKSEDYELIRYELNILGVNPNVASKFTQLYAVYREYVVYTLYNPKMENMYANYRSFIGLIIKFYTLMQISNSAVESMNSKQFLDDSIIYLILSMYNIPSNIILTNSIRRKLVRDIYSLVQNKATNVIYYKIADILGYQDLVVSKLMLMKNQDFSDNGLTLKNDDTDLNGSRDIDSLSMSEYDATAIGVSGTSIKCDPQFVKLDILDDNPYETIANGDAAVYNYNEIIDDDPFWWDLSDTRHILENSNYTMVDTKYIMLEVTIHQMQYLFESIYFTRMIIDNKDFTDATTITIPELFGTTGISLYDLMVCIMCASCMTDGLDGTIISDTGDMRATAGFNFDIDQDILFDYMDSCNYADVDKIRTWLNDITMDEMSDISRLYADIMHPMREWLEYKISQSDNRYEYLEYENIYRALFTYDSCENPFVDDFEMPLVSICNSYNLSTSDMVSYMHFYPRTISGDALTSETIVDDLRYSEPFISNDNKVTWYADVNIIDPDFGLINRGRVYFHDILNYSDIREITNESGDRVFMDYEDDSIGWQINELAIASIISTINNLSENELSKATFQAYTVNTNYDKSDEDSKSAFNKGDYLAANIRASIFKQILIDKITMDSNGFCIPPVTYLEYLYRRNSDLYNILIKDNRFEYDRESWMNDITSMITTLETEVGLHLKYFEQSVVGSDMFFKPLVSLINHFKSTFVQIARTSINYVIGDKIDAGGNSNMLKLFDDLSITIRFIVLAKRGYESQLGLYDAEYKCTYHFVLSDISKMVYQKINGYDVYKRELDTGSLNLMDEIKFLKNGVEVDPNGYTSAWHSGEPGTGRWESDNSFVNSTYYIPERTSVGNYDKEGWKKYVEGV